MLVRKLPVLVVFVVACLLGGATASAAQTRTYNDADAEFTRMMIPHHHQAIVMSDLVPDRSADERMAALADRIHTEQGFEITSMLGWQGRNGLPVTDAEAAYEELLGQPEKLEEMGMATPAELDRLAASSGEEFDVLFLDLMITHHQGVVRMLREVLLNGSDVQLHQQAQDMRSTQRAQIAIMEDMREQKTA